MRSDWEFFSLDQDFLETGEKNTQLDERLSAAESLNKGWIPELFKVKKISRQV